MIEKRNNHSNFHSEYAERITLWGEFEKYHEVGSVNNNQ